MEGPAHVLVTGASGVLGWRLVHFFRHNRWRVEGTYCRNPARIAGVNFRQVDLADTQSLRHLVRGFDCDLLVHSAAMTSPDACAREPGACRRISVEATRVLAESLPSRVRLVFVSTDLVYGGQGCRYREEDPPDPLNLYGESKLEAEQILLQRPATWILRMAKIYAAGSPFHPCFATWMRDRFEAGQRIPLFRDQFRSPLYVGDMGPIVETLFRLQPERKLFHAGGPERMNRLELGLLFAKALGYSADQIDGISAVSLGLAPRGQDCSLDSSRLFALLGRTTTPVREGMRCLRRDFENPG